MVSDLQQPETFSGDCLDAGAFFMGLKTKAAIAGVPVFAVIALTYRCNFRCVHCYVRQPGKVGPELTGGEWLGVIDTLAEAGCLFLIITGGEPLLHPDFAEIYRHARQKGMLVTVFTNASLIDETHVRLFKEYPPRQVDVSIYGMSEEVHRGVAGVEGMSERVIRSVCAMHCAGLRVGLKTVALKENGSEVAAMRRLAEELGVRFRFDVCVAPTLDGGRMPVSHRLPVQEAVALEMAEGGRKGRSGQERGRDSGKTGGGSLYVCSAGRSMAFVGPDGSVSPCPMATHRRYGSACDSFGSAWDRMVHDIRALQADKDSACVNCTKSVYCGHCPAFCYLDVGSESEPSPYLCEIGEARRLAFEGF